MGRINRKRRSSVIKLKQKRQQTLAQLRQMYQKKKDKGEVKEKLIKVAPWLSVDNFIKAIKKEEKA